MSIVAPKPGTELDVVEGPRTWVRSLEDLPDGAPPQQRRYVTTVTAEERLVVFGSVASALAMAWVICFRLLPWGTVLGYTIVALALFLLTVSVTTAIVSPGPAVADRVAAAVIAGGAVLVGIALLTTIIFTFLRGTAALANLNMFTQDMSGVGPRDPLNTGGALHAIVGTLIQIGIAIVVTVPLGIGTAVFMTEVGGRFARLVRTIVEAMTALPSIVAGLFIYTTIILVVGISRSGFAAAMALSVMMLPIIARSADVVLRLVPSGLREASLALGAPRWRTVWHVVLPTARSGLATALILGVARGIGETSPVLLTSGAATFLVMDPVAGPMNSLPLFVFDAVRSGEDLLIQRGFAAATILLALVLALFVAARLLARQRTGR